MRVTIRCQSQVRAQSTSCWCVLSLAESCVELGGCGKAYQPPLPKAAPLCVGSVLSYNALSSLDY
jgi:hypothetical protein